MRARSSAIPPIGKRGGARRSADALSVATLALLQPVFQNVRGSLGRRKVAITRSDIQPSCLKRALHGVAWEHYNQRLGRTSPEKRGLNTSETDFHLPPPPPPPPPSHPHP